MGRADLQRAVEGLHGCKAEWIEDATVREHFAGEVVWDGVVSVFAVTGHATATRVYAWSYLVDEKSGRRRFLAILGVPPVDDPVTAVRAAIASGQQQ